MEKFLVITIDVEPDCTPNWQYSDPLTFHGVSEGVVNRLHPLFIQFDIKPTYLINNVVLEDAQSVNVFKTLEGKFELGTHLHPEFIAPQKEFDNYAGKKGAANCCFYEPSIESGKIKSITDLFISSFGHSPTSFRAGRFSAGTNTINTLDKLGYKVDTSVTPHVCWNDKTRERPVDYTNSPGQPYFIKTGAYPNAGDGNILEVPVSIAARKISAISAMKKAVKNKSLSISTTQPVWLRPVYSNITDFQFILEQTDQKYSSNEAIVYNMMFHNVEVMPGLSPYTKTEADCANYLQSLKWLFEYCAKNNIKAVCLSDLYDIFKK